MKLDAKEKLEKAQIASFGTNDPDSI